MKTTSLSGWVCGDLRYARHFSLDTAPCWAGGVSEHWRKLKERTQGTTEPVCRTNLDKIVFVMCRALFYRAFYQQQYKQKGTNQTCWAATLNAAGCHSYEIYLTTTDTLFKLDHSSTSSSIGRSLHTDLQQEKHLMLAQSVAILGFKSTKFGLCAFFSCIWPHNVFSGFGTCSDSNLFFYFLVM